MSKRKKSKADKAVREFQRLVAKLIAKDKKIKNMADGTVSQLGRLESQCIDLLRRAKNLLDSEEFAKHHGSISAATPELDAALLRVRKSYIAKLGAAYKYNIDAGEILRMPEYADLKFSARDLIFKKIVGGLIPEHPKDEFTRARQSPRRFVIHCGDTNTGKTYHALQALSAAATGVYLAPLRLLALQVFQTLNDNGVLCTLSTGEEDIITPGAAHISSTVEKLNLDERYDVAVIDEAQMIADKQRGSAWTKAVLGVLAGEVHICCSPNAVSLLIKLITDCGDSYTVCGYERDTELVLDKANFVFPRSVRRGDALVVFSKKMVLGVSSALAERRRKASVIYGNLPPETRRTQMQMFASGETDIVVTTDAIGMGLNLPVKRVVFLETKKFDGEESRPLLVSEIKQISGRAGRKNIYDVGYVNSIGDKDYIGRAIKAKLPDLERAYYIPLEKYVLSLPMGTLEERLLCCMDARAGLDYIHKADIDQPLKLLRIITREPLNLTLEEMCRLIFIPFDEGSAKLLRQWHGYVRAYVEHGYFGVPEISSETLDELELYYKSLDLYYSFCKTMGVAFSKEQVMRLKYQTAEKIHALLRTSIKAMSRKCSRCGAKLEWNFIYNICDGCHDARHGPQ